MLLIGERAASANADEPRIVFDGGGGGAPALHFTATATEALGTCVRACVRRCAGKRGRVGAWARECVDGHIVFDGRGGAPALHFTATAP